MAGKRFSILLDLTSCFILLDLTSCFIRSPSVQQKQKREYAIFVPNIYELQLLLLLLLASVSAELKKWIL